MSWKDYLWQAALVFKKLSYKCFNPVNVTWLSNFAELTTDTVFSVHGIKIWDYDWNNILTIHTKTPNKLFDYRVQNVQTVIAKVNKKHMKKLTSNPSSIDKCIASLARFGTFSITSRPSCKQLIQQLLIFLNINVHVNNCKFNEITDTSQYYNRHTEHTIHSMIDTQSTQYTVQ